LIAKGTDPAGQRVVQRLTENGRVANTLKEAVDAWHAFRSKAWKERTATQVREYLDKDLLPSLKAWPLDVVTARELGELVAGIERRGSFDVAKKARQWLKAIFSYARAMGWTKNDPARDLAATAEKGPAAQNFPYSEPAELPAFLRQLAEADSALTVQDSAMLSIWLGNRPGVARTLKWAKLDLDAGVR
jgi:integrase